jgi:hypothetical protein
VGKTIRDEGPANAVYVLDGHRDELTLHAVYKFEAAIEVLRLANQMLEEAAEGPATVLE